MKVQRVIRGGTQLLRGYVRTGRWGVRIEGNVRLRGGGTYDLRPGSVLRTGARVFVQSGATLTLHPGASIGGNAIVNVMDGLEIGERTMMSWNCQVLDTDFHAIVDLDGTTRPLTKRIEIGSDVMIGTGTIILKGAVIGTGSYIGAGSVVSSKPIPPRSAVAGNPATVIRAIAGWIP